MPPSRVREMSESERYQLFGTLGCHLCREAEAVLGQLRLPVTHRDIAEDEVLLARYGTVIPVLRDNRTGAELHWPFDADQVFAWVATGGE